jgi:hypothetical protein
MALTVSLQRLGETVRKQKTLKPVETDRAGQRRKRLSWLLQDDGAAPPPLFFC